MSALLSLAASPPAPSTYPDAAAWWRDHVARTARFDAPIDRAIAGALAVDRIAWAFAGGYVAALQQLVPSMPRDAYGSLAATEEGGAHPRAIQTTLESGRLRGHKRWVTMPNGASGFFFVVAKTPGLDHAGRPRLVLVRVKAGAPGVTVTASSASIVPEIQHGALDLDVGIDPADVLPGDGYTDYLKPFRTVEDLHVHGAIVALALALAHRVDGPPAPRERLLAVVPTIRALAVADPKLPALHLALGGVLAIVQEALAALEPSFEALDAPTYEAWKRDRALFSVAAKARAARLEAAWQAGRPTSVPAPA